MATLRILAPEGTTNYVKNPSLRYDTTGWYGIGLSNSTTRVTATLLTSNYDNVDRTSYTTASISPSANKLILLSVFTRHGTTAIAPTSVTGCGLTWVLIADVASGVADMSVWRAMNASPTSGTLTIDFGATTLTGCAWSIVELDNVDTSGANGSGAVVQSGSVLGSGTSGTVTLSTFSDANNATFASFGITLNETIDAEPGYTKLVGVSGAIPLASMMTEFYAANDTTPSAVWTNSTGRRGVGLEIRARGGTVERTLTRARFGVASAKMTTEGNALYEGAYYRLNNLTGISDALTASVYLRGAGRVRTRLIDNLSGQQWISPVTLLNDEGWQRVSVTGRCTGGDDVRVYVETDDRKAVVFYADGLQVERKGYATTYCDGDQEGCRWNIMAHNSISVRESDTRAGGRWVQLSGDERAEENLYMTEAGGFGLPPITNNLQSYADAPGSFYQNTKILARPMTLLFHARHSQTRITCKEPSLDALHQLRQLLIDLIKPDKTAGGEEFLLEYQDGDTPLYIRTRYDGGLEGDWDVRNSWISSFPLRLLAVSPFWYEDDQQVSVLDFQEWNTSNFVSARLDGAWGNMNFGFNNTVYDLVFGSRGEVIAVGAFTRANSDVSAIDPLIPANYIAYWDGTQWNRYGIGANGEIRAVAVAPNGYVYVTGAFTSIGGVAANRVAYWDGTQWNAMGTGINDVGYAIAVDPNGDVYVGGAFTSAGGGGAQKIALWDGAWHVVGNNSGLNGTVRTIAISSDGITVYAGGDFTDEAGLATSALLYAAVYDTVTGLYSELGDGFNGAVYKLRLAPSGTLYACGAFTGSGSESINRIAYFNGATWLAMGAGLNGTAYSLAVHSNGELLAVGDFDEAGGVDTSGVALWNGSTWTNLDIVQDEIIYAVLYDSDRNIYIGADSPLHTSAVTTVTNTGSAETPPLLYILGPALLKYIENQTNHKRVYLDLDILEDEEVFFDFGRGKVTSTVRGDLSYAVLPGSDMRAFTLLPGANSIATLMVEDFSASLSMSYIPRHWSVDATARTEEL